MTEAKTTTDVPRQWADGPFPLITSPAFTTSDYKDPFTAAASHMSCIHNIIIRGLNAIYLQAPFVTPELAPDFLGYSTAWSTFLHIHHSGEEALFFPKIEAATGVPGIMEPNVQQHAAFSPGLHEFSSYISSATPESFSGSRLVEIIESFASTLTQHLADEIPTLVALREYGEKVDIARFDEEEGKHGMKAMSLKVCVPFFITAMDVTYEGGIHADFPPAPGLIKAIGRRVCTRFNKGFWRFAPCDRMGQPQKMLLAPAKK